MAFGTLDYDKIKEDNGFAPLPTGEYEMVVKNVQEYSTKNGAESINITFIVRNDLDNVDDLKETNGKYHNRQIIMNNWKRKKTNDYDMNGLMLVAKQAGVPDGTTFANFEEYAQTLYHKPLRVYVKKETDTYEGKEQERNQIAPWNCNETEFPKVQHDFNKSKTAKDKANEKIDDALDNFGKAKKADSSQKPADPFEKNGDELDLDDDDLPF